MTTGSSLKTQMGGAVAAAVDAVADAGMRSLSIADAGTKEAFLDSWSRILVEHARLLREKGEPLTAPVVMVFVPDWSIVGKQLGWQRSPMLGSRESDPLAGFLGLGALEIGAYVRRTPIKDTHEATDVIEQSGLGDFLTIALMDSSKLWIWPHGINAETNPYRRELVDYKFVLDLEYLDRSLKEFYEEIARQTRRWWLDRDKRIAVGDTEAVVQEALWHFLIGAYANRAKVRQEVWSGNGRMDLVLRPLNMQDTSAVLELKVTKDYATPKEGTKTPTRRSFNENREWAVSGVAQTAGYRDQEKLNVAFLCVYDFCDGDLATLEEAIQTASAMHSVHGRRYWITASNKESREARYPLENSPPLAPAAVVPNTEGSSAPLVPPAQ